MKTPYTHPSDPFSSSLEGEVAKIRYRHGIFPFNPYNVILAHDPPFFPQCREDELTLIKDNLALALTSNCKYVRDLAEYIA